MNIGCLGGLLHPIGERGLERNVEIGAEDPTRHRADADKPLPEAATG